MKRSFDSGSSPLELVALTALLLLPIGLGTSVYLQISNELAAESIARHALRLAMLENPERPSENIADAVRLFASNWQVSTSEGGAYDCHSHVRTADTGYHVEI